MFVAEKGGKMVASLSDGIEAHGGFILDGDAMHSVVRSEYVEQTRNHPTLVVQQLLLWPTQTALKTFFSKWAGAISGQSGSHITFAV